MLFDTLVQNFFKLFAIHMNHFVDFTASDLTRSFLHYSLHIDQARSLLSIVISPNFGVWNFIYEN